MEAATNGIKLKDLVTEFVEKGLAGYLGQPPAPRARSPLPVIRPATGATHPALSNQEIEQLLTSEDGRAGA